MTDTAEWIGEINDEVKTKREALKKEIAAKRKKCTKIRWQWQYRSNVLAETLTKVTTSDETKFMGWLESENVEIIETEGKSLDAEFAYVQDAVKGKHKNAWDTSAYFAHDEPDNTIAYGTPAERDTMLTKMSAVAVSVGSYGGAASCKLSKLGKVIQQGSIESTELKGQWLDKNPECCWVTWRAVQISGAVYTLDAE